MSTSANHCGYELKPRGNRMCCISQNIFCILTFLGGFNFNVNISSFCLQKLLVGIAVVVVIGISKKVFLPLWMAHWVFKAPLLGSITICQNFGPNCYSIDAIIGPMAFAECQMPWKAGCPCVIICLWRRLRVWIKVWPKVRTNGDTVNNTINKWSHGGILKMPSAQWSHPWNALNAGKWNFLKNDVN